MLHKARKFVSSLVRTAQVDRSPRDPASASSPTSRFAENELLHGRLTADEHAQWFISLRWIAVLVAVILIIVAVHVIKVLPEAVWLPLIGTVAGLAVLNLLYMAWLRSGKGMAFITAFQAYADLILLTILIHFSGGIENPLVLLMIFHVIIAGITLSRRQCYAVAFAATALFAILAWAEAAGFVQHYTLRIVPHYEEQGHTAHAAHDPVYAASFVGLQGAILLLTSFFVTTLAERLRQKERQLEEMTQRALRQGQLLEQALDTTGTGLFVCDENRQPILTNGRWESWFAPAQLEPAVRAQIFGEASPIRLTLEDGNVRMTEIEVTGSDAAPRTFQATTAPLLDKQGRITHVVQLVQDITDRKAAQAKMMRAGQLAAVGELAGQVAHEVNNPISIINAKARILLSDFREELSGRTIHELEKIIHLSDRVADIAKGLLSYGRPSTASRMQLDVGIPIRRALNMIGQRAAGSGIEVDDDLSREQPPVYANAQELEQVFLNLFLNAMDAMPAGGRLTVSSYSDQGRHSEGSSSLYITVQDTGEGMSEAVQERIFEPFFTTKPEGKGSGLGLSICQGLVQNYGGTINVQSAKGRGTRITIRLPIYQSVSEANHG